MTALPVLASMLLAAEPVAFVICAPGYPGSTAEAQASMDAFAAALTARAGWPAGSLVGAYYESEKAGAERLARPDAVVGMFTLPFFLEEAGRAKLQPRLAAVQAGSEADEVWSLVAKKGRVTGPGSLAGWKLVSIAGYAPAFVRGVALGAWGKLPATTEIVQSSQVLSWLRKAAAGDNVALLLDGMQGKALGTLPFAPELEVVARSAPVPGGVVATVGKRLPPERWAALEKALRSLRESPEGAAALDGIRLEAFVPMDDAALAAARKSYGAAER
ncbi:MAG TPA: PhnD/SsuA/transferrin family substrate-binding protein [Anaeromyxobacteraceae bacterium]|nr:PhnD/SsuA/transferrin family substrate-binding protein [Anaeromyxobacteraceae bacterium]